MNYYLIDCESTNRSGIICYKYVRQDIQRKVSYEQSSISSARNLRLHIDLYG